MTHIWQMLLVFICIVFNGIDEVLSDLFSFGFTLNSADPDKAFTYAPITVTFYHNYTIFQCVLHPNDPNAIGEQLQCNSSIWEIVGTLQTHCNGPQFKMIIQNDDPNTDPDYKNGGEAVSHDGVIIDSVFFDDTDGNIYTIDKFCYPKSETDKWFDSLQKDGYGHWEELTNICEPQDDYYYINVLCVDDEAEDCRPAKKIVYFNISKPNETIIDAVWENGADLVIESITCSPTFNPTLNPTMQPTSNPTVNPTLPTIYPTVHPTIYPTVNPTTIPTRYPLFTQNPTVPPTRNPVLNPTSYPTVKPSRSPTSSVFSVSPTNQYLFHSTAADIESVKSKQDNILQLEYFIAFSIIAVSVCVLSAVSTLCVHLFRGRKRNSTKAESESDKNAVVNVVKINDRKEGETKKVRLVDELIKYTANAERINKRAHKPHINLLELQNWLENEVELPEYFDIFVNNGYDSMQIIREIRDITELNEIGIKSAHIQKKMMKEIEKWRCEHEENRKREGSHWNDLLHGNEQLKYKATTVTTKNVSSSTTKRMTR